MLTLLLSACDDLWIDDYEICDDPRRWYRDEDGDGYGRVTDWIWGCSARDEYSAFDEKTFDCDDTDARHSVQCRWTQVTTGDADSCALTEKGEVTCWGLNGTGQGDAPEGEVFSWITAGDYHTCGLRAADGTVTCWGRDEFSSLDLGDLAETPFLTMEAGLDSACGVLAAGGAACIGNTLGQGSDDAIAVTTQAYGACFLHPDGSLTCNANGTPADDVLAEVPPLATVDIGFSNYGCGLDDQRHIHCFGQSETGWSPTDPGPKWTGAWHQVQAGHDGACGIKDVGGADRGPIECWGAEGAGAATPPEGDFAQLSYSIYHACALDADGAIACWGTDDFGETRPPDLLRFLSVDAGGTFTIATRNDGEVVIVGTVDPTWRTSFSDIYAGYHVVCALRGDGSPECWNERGHDDAFPPSSARFATLDLGKEHGCGVRRDTGHEGAILCWGDNSHGEAPDQDRAGPFLSVSVGTDYSCGLLESGEVECWGDVEAPPEGSFRAIAASESYGTCGIPTADDAGIQCWGVGTTWDVQGATVEQPPSTGTYVDLEAGTSHWCARSDQGRIACFGMGFTEGSGQYSRVSDPGGTYARVAVGAASNCVQEVNGDTYCWGGWIDVYGRWDAPSDPGFEKIVQGDYFGCGLGSGSVTCWGEAPAYPGGVQSLSAGAEHACGLSDQGLVCFGDDEHGEVAPPAGMAFVDVEAGAAYTCGRTLDGSIACWGDDGEGLVSGAPTDAGHTALSAGRYQACALDADGRASCWGDAAGDAPATRFVGLATGAHHACGLTAAGEVECWGDNGEGQLNRHSCPDDAAFTQIDAGDYHTCGLCEGGTVVCWGLDSHGQVSGVDPWKFVSVSAGAEHSCGVKSDGLVACWGRDLEGQLDFGYPWDY